MKDPSIPIFKHSGIQAFRHSRRKFLKASALILPAMHLGLQSCTNMKENTNLSDESNRILRIELMTKENKIEEQKQFYTTVLNLPLITEDGNSFEVLAGKTVIKFMLTKGEEQPFYHFAFNIPENKIGKAMDWSKDRFELLKNKYGEDLIYFEKWDADAIYFYDPAGNILEFIAHHPLKNSSDNAFTEKDILNVCELGIVTDNVKKLSREIDMKIGISDYRLRAGIPLSSEFRALGNPNGMLIITKENRKWLMTDKRAQNFQSSIHFRNSYSKKLKFDNTACLVNLVRE